MFVLFHFPFFLLLLHQKAMVELLKENELGKIVGGRWYIINGVWYYVPDDEEEDDNDFTNS